MPGYKLRIFSCVVVTRMEAEQITAEIILAELHFIVELKSMKVDRSWNEEEGQVNNSLLK
ncbi:hypothetical protein [Clostridium sp.]